MTTEVVRLERRNYSTLAEARKTTSRTILWSAFTLTTGVSMLFLIAMSTPVCGYVWPLVAWACCLGLIAMSLTGFFIAYLDRAYFDYMQPDSVTRVTQQETPAEVRIEVQEGTTIKRGKFQFTPEDWRTIGHFLRKNDWYFNRPIIKKSRMFDNAHDNYGEIQGEFERLGMIEYSGRRWQVTREGQAFFEQV